MNFQFLQTQGLIPQGAVPVYGTAAGGPFLGPRGLLGAPPSLLASNPAATGNASALHAQQQAAVFRGMRSQMIAGIASQTLAPQGQAVVTGVAPVARYIVPTSQPVSGMYVIPGGVMQAMEPSSLLGTSGSPSESALMPGMEGQDDSQDMMMNTQMMLAQQSMQAAGSQFLYSAAAAAGQPLLVPHHGSAQSLFAHQQQQQQQSYHEHMQQQQQQMQQQMQSSQQQQLQPPHHPGQQMPSQQTQSANQSQWMDAGSKGDVDHRISGSLMNKNVQPPNMADHERDPDEPLVDFDKTVLDFFNSDLHLEISKDSYSAEALTKPPGFCFCWAGCRATYGACSGKICYEVRITEHLEVDFGEDHQEVDPHIVRVGWSMDQTSFQLGEEPDSWGYGGSGKFSTNNRFSNYGEPFTKGDVIMAMVDLEARPPKISYAKNGKWLGVASPLHGYKVGNRDQALFPHILSKNCRFEVNFGQRPPWHPPPHPGYMYIDHVPLHQRVRGMLPPPRKADCEMIMIVGLPGAGKTTWAQKVMKEQTQKRYNIIGTDTLIDKMRVMGLPRKNNYHGRWDILIQKATNCLNKLFQIASRRRRNYILDQTNVYASARKRKMRHFVGFKRICAIVQPDDDELKRREWKRTFEDGKVVPEEAVLEMKFNYSLPYDSEPHVDDIMWIELRQEKSQELVQQYVNEAKEKLPPKEKDRGFYPPDNSGHFQQQQQPGPGYNQRQSWDNQGSIGGQQHYMDHSSGPGPEKRPHIESKNALDFIKQEYEENQSADPSSGSNWHDPKRDHGMSYGGYQNYGQPSEGAPSSFRQDQDQRYPQPPGSGDNFGAAGGGMQSQQQSTTMGREDPQNYWGEKSQQWPGQSYDQKPQMGQFGQPPYDQQQGGANLPDSGIGQAKSAQQYSSQGEGYRASGSAGPLSYGAQNFPATGVSGFQSYPNEPAVKTEDQTGYPSSESQSSAWQGMSAPPQGQQAAGKDTEQDYYTQWNNWSQAYSMQLNQTGMPGQMPPARPPPPGMGQAQPPVPQVFSGPAGMNQHPLGMNQPPPGLNQVGIDQPPPNMGQASFHHPPPGAPPGQPPIRPPLQHNPNQPPPQSLMPPTGARPDLNAPGLYGNQWQSGGFSSNQSKTEGGSGLQQQQQQGNNNMPPGIRPLMETDAGKPADGRGGFGNQEDRKEFSPQGGQHFNDRHDRGGGRGDGGGRSDDRGRPDFRDRDNRGGPRGGQRDQRDRGRDYDCGGRGDRDQDRGRDFRGDRDFGRDRDRNRDRDRDQGRDRDRDQGSRDRDRDQGSQDKDRDQGSRDKDRDQGRERDRDQGRDRDRDHGRDRDRERDRDQGRDRDADRERNRDRGRDRDRDANRGRENAPGAPQDGDPNQKKETKKRSRWEQEPEEDKPRPLMSLMSQQLNPPPSASPAPGSNQLGILGEPPASLKPTAPGPGFSAQKPADESGGPPANMSSILGAPPPGLPNKPPGPNILSLMSQNLDKSGVAAKSPPGSQPPFSSSSALPPPAKQPLMALPTGGSPSPFQMNQSKMQSSEMEFSEHEQPEKKPLLENFNEDHDGYSENERFGGPPPPLFPRGGMPPRGRFESARGPPPPSMSMRGGPGPHMPFGGPPGGPPRGMRGPPNFGGPRPPPLGGPRPMPPRGPPMGGMNRDGPPPRWQQSGPPRPPFR